MTQGKKFVYNSQLDAFTLYHLVNEANARSSVSGGPALPALGHALAGGLGSAAAKGLVYPLDLVVTRLQVQKQLRGKGETENAARDADAEYTGLVDAAEKIYRNEGGIPAFFSGCSSDVGKGLIDSFLFFLAYSWLRNFEMKKRQTDSLSVPVELAVGVAAGSLSKLCTTPIQNVVTRQQTAALVAARNPDAAEDKSATSVTRIARKIYKERGLAGFWAGYDASVILTANPAITFAADNLMRTLLPKNRRQNPGPYLTFLIAACSKAIATSITYPVQLAKSRAQSGGGSDDDDEGEEARLGGSSISNEKSGAGPSLKKQPVKFSLHWFFKTFAAQYKMYMSLRKIYRKEGLSGLYSGLEGDLMKGFISHGLTMMLKENVHTGVIQLYYVLLKLTRRWPEELQKAQESVVQAGQAVSDGAQRLVADAKDALGSGD